MKMNREEFLGRVRQDFGFDAVGGTEPLIRTVREALGDHVTEGEWDDIRSGMPRELAGVLP